MKFLHPLEARTLLLAVLFLLSTFIPACAQEKPKRMVRGQSVEELVPESPNEKEDGIAQIVLGQLFKPGPTEYARVGAAGLRDAPPLPTGFVLFKDLVFLLKTEAITSGYNLTVFSIPSANDVDFGKLTILHLEVDEMSPAGRSWVPVGVFPGTWDKHYYPVSQKQYDALAPDATSKRIAAITNQFGVFALALASESEPGPSLTSPFTQIEVVPSSSPQPVAVGEEITHTILIKNLGPRTAAELNIKAEMDATFDYKAHSNQGGCKRSDRSSGRILCHLGAMPPNSTVTITIVGRVSPNTVLTKEISDFGNMLEIVFKANPTDLINVDNQIFKEFDFKIRRKP